MDVLKDVRVVLSNVLQLGDRGSSLDRDSALLGALPELDSMAVVNVLVAIEDHFGIQLDDDEISAESFGTLGSLADLIETKL